MKLLVGMVGQRRRNGAGHVGGTEIEHGKFTTGAGLSARLLLLLGCIRTGEALVMAIFVTSEVDFALKGTATESADEWLQARVLASVRDQVGRLAERFTANFTLVRIRVGRNTDWKCHADQCPCPISDIGTSGNKCNDERKAALDVGKICFCVQIDAKQMRMVVDALTSTDNVIALPLMNNHRAPAGMTRQARADSFRKVPAIRGHLP
ncbi:hypothetical protein T12_14530 [Trichinella patagoniensis]|uniref:Uncharacterized protein n=1 Tax=Trichinella patagoniensis TaxID=990121 RepID=A0A0V1A2T7_9BILA|nr:hypothetical protein T12_14530 [Trichinella patagoniensis]